MEIVTEQAGEHAPMANQVDADVKSSKRPLEPVERLSEILFGLIMVVTFTCSISIHEAGQEEVKTMLVAATGCNLAWGIIDAFLYMLACFIERGHGITTLRGVRSTLNHEAAHSVIAKAMPPLLASVISRGALEDMRAKLIQLPELAAHPEVTKEDWLGGLAVFSAVFLSTFPVVIPFLLTTNAVRALRISNGIAVAMLFLNGYALGRYAGYRPWRMGLWMAFIGASLVALTIVLGG